MKIALVLDDTLDKLDGVQQTVIPIGNWLKSQGHEVHYIVAETKRQDISNVHSIGRFVNLNFNKNNVRLVMPVWRRKIKNLLESENFDVIHVMMPYNPFMGKQVIRYAGPKTAVIGTFHTLPASKAHLGANMALRLWLGKSLKRFDKVIGVSEPTVFFAHQAYGVKAEYLPNPIVEDDFKSGRRLPQYNDRKINILFLGRLVKRKGILELIKAYNALDDEVAKTTRLLVAGKGPLRAKAKSMVASGRDVTFLGFVAEKDKANYLATADIAVFPSTSGEAFGLVIVEAMAAGAGVVIGGNNPGYSSILSPQPFLLFNPADLTAFVDTLKLFISDKALRQKMQAWQNETMVQYDIKVVGPALQKIYEQSWRQRQEVR